jgi:hypothetical protein
LPPAGHRWEIIVGQPSPWAQTAAAAIPAALTFDPVRFSRRDLLCSERDSPITLAQSDGIVRCHGLLVPSSLRAGLEHDAGEAKARSEGMQLIVSVGRQDKPGIGAGSPAKKGPALTSQLMHVHSHGFLARLPFSACPFRVSDPGPFGCHPKPGRFTDRCPHPVH